ncbi:hypothetical protein WA158_004544 [Blastocystis sp. Blastoise]
MLSILSSIGRSVVMTSSIVSVSRLSTNFIRGFSEVASSSDVLDLSKVSSMKNMESKSESNDSRSVEKRNRNDDRRNDYRDDRRERRSGSYNRNGGYRRERNDRDDYRRRDSRRNDRDGSYERRPRTFDNDETSLDSTKKSLDEVEGERRDRRDGDRNDRRSGSRYGDRRDRRDGDRRSGSRYGDRDNGDRRDRRDRDDRRDRRDGDRRSGSRYGDRNERRDRDDRRDRRERDRDDRRDRRERDNGKEQLKDIRDYMNGSPSSPSLPNTKTPISKDILYTNIMHFKIILEMYIILYIVKIMDIIKEKNIPLIEVPTFSFDATFGNHKNQGLALRAKKINWRPILTVDEVADKNITNSQGNKQIPLVVCLDRITDTVNIGSIIRTAAFFGISGVVTENKFTAPLNASASICSGGAVDLLYKYKQLACVDDMSEFLLNAQANDWDILTTSVTEGTPINNYISTSLSKPTILIMGNEGVGVRSAIKKYCNGSITIPRPTSLIPAVTPEDFATTDSLNVNVSLAILLNALRH